MTRALRASLVVAASFAVAVGAGCATFDDGRLVVLKPSQVAKDFKDLDAKGKNPFAEKGATRVDHLVVELKSYDAFFQDTAEIKGTVVLADVVLKETDAYIAKVKKQGGRKSLGDAGQKEFDKKKDRLTTISGLLTAVPGRSGDLADQGQKLSGGAAKTFVGPNAFKLPGVVKGIERSIEDLKAAGKKAPGLADHAGKTLRSLVALE